MKLTSNQEQHKGIIRPLKFELDELEAMCRFGKAFTEESNAGSFVDGRFLDSMHKIISNKRGIILVLEVNNKIVGTIGMAAYRPFYNDRLRVQEMFWWVDHEYRNTRDSIRLINKVEEWAKEIGADEVMVSSTTMNADKIERFYTKKGFRKMDINYIRSLKDA